MTSHRSRLARIAGSPRLPLVLAAAAVVLMLPALPAGLFVDDLIQRPTQFTPAELPARLLETGLVVADAGTLRAVVRDLFGFLRSDESAALAKAYGLVPWWAPEEFRAALWRPVTAFTHWVDYRLFPDSPALMHLHNIFWYALAVFLAASLYRAIAPRSAATAAGLAACLFLLDKDTYAPVLYVANRGFVIALVFGLLTLALHRRWRATGAHAAFALALLTLTLALLANEAGVSALAFLIAYALVLEPGGWRRRLGSLGPTAVVVVLWRLVYWSAGYGVRNGVGYVDPGYAPGFFLRQLAARANGLLGGQLTGVPPEIAMALGPCWRIGLAVFFALAGAIVAVVFLPLLRRDRIARFWATVMVLALVPAATVAPFSKNLGFVAMGALSC